MQTGRARLSPKTAFGASSRGDTLFDRLYWVARFGESCLNGLLDRCAQEHPDAMIPDALLADHPPRPNVPARWHSDTAGDREAMKEQAWWPVDEPRYLVAQWLAHHRPVAGLLDGNADACSQRRNSINGATNARGGGFAPCGVEQYWFDQQCADKPVARAPHLDPYAVLDDARVRAEERPTFLKEMRETVAIRLPARDGTP